MNDGQLMRARERATFIELLNLAEHFLAQRQPEAQERALRKRIADALTQAPAVETTDVLKTIYRLAGGHSAECQCRQCEIFELLEPIVGNTSPRSADS